MKREGASFVLRLALVLAGLALALVAFAADTTVQVSDGAPHFQPATVNISVGDRVTWQNTGGLHNVRANDGSFTSGAVSTSAWTFTHLFGTPGSTTYQCDEHSGFTGIVNVESAGQPGALRFSSAAFSRSEGSGTATITVRRVDGASGAISVSYATSDGTATADSDYSASSGSLSWATGDSSNKSFAVPILEDATVEGNETINLSLSDATGGAGLGNPNSAVLTIVDNDSGPPADPGSLQLSASSVSASEGDGSVTISVRRVDGASGAVSVSYATSDGTATAGSDYTATAGTLSWGNNDSSNKSFNIALVDDSIVEGDETVNLDLSNATGGADLGSPSSATLTIVDNDALAGILEFTDTAFLGSEGDHESEVSVVVNRTGGNSGAVSVSFTSSDLSATAGSDYSSTSGTLTWADGDDAPKSINLAVLGDDEQERTELVRLVLSQPTGGAQVGDGDTAVVAVLDDDSPGGCAVQGSNLCLLGGRFKVEVEWRNQRNAATGLGEAVADSDKTGLFWFFSPTNIELIVKVLDGTPINGFFWVFYGALSDVEYWVVVTDTETSLVQVYRNTPFNICGLADTSAFLEGESSSALGSAAIAQSALLRGAVLRPMELVPSTQIRLGPEQECSPGPQTLCLLSGRFSVDVDWHDPRSGSVGVGTAVPNSDEAGLFWFFDAANIELVVKLLDATAFNEKFWVFYGALSDVEYTITVTDTETGTEKQYMNEFGNVCGLADTNAFDAP